MELRRPAGGVSDGVAAVRREKRRGLAASGKSGTCNADSDDRASLAFPMNNDKDNAKR